MEWKRLSRGGLMWLGAMLGALMATPGVSAAEESGPGCGSFARPT
ncbi:hypothetical protein [Thauera humireducens]